MSKTAQSIIADKDSADALIERINVLQDSHRLAIHCFEDNAGQCVYPGETLQRIAQNEHASLPKLLENNKAAILSLSLLPSLRSGHTLLPYHTKGPAYLFDLTSKDSASARVVHVFESNAWTGENQFEKNLHIGALGADKTCKSLYEGKSESDLRIKAANDLMWSEQQLNALGAYTDAQPSSDTPLPHNEVLAAVTKQHIAAIAVPVDGSTSIAKLKGALAGLEHIKHGMNLPVVLYPIHGAHKGRCSFFAQGEENLRKEAFNAIKEIQAIPNPTNLLAQGNAYFANRLYKDLPWLKYQCQAVLGIDMNKPLPQSKSL